MSWTFVAATVGFVGWVLWRAYEAWAFRILLESLGSDMSDESVRSFMERLATRSVPNARGFWNQLRSLEARVMGDARVSPQVKSEFRSLLQSKGAQF